MSYSDKAQMVLRHTNKSNKGVTIDREAPLYVRDIIDGIIRYVEDQWAVNVAYEVIQSASELAPEDDTDSPAFNQMVQRHYEPQFTLYEQTAWWVINRKYRRLRQSVADAMAVTDTTSAIELVQMAERDEREQIVNRTLALLKGADNAEPQEISFDDT